MTTAPRPNRVALRGVGKTYPGPKGGTVQVLSDIDLTVADGEFVALVGPSGCGKSTVLRLISGLVPASAGEVLVDGVPVDGPPRSVGFMFQRDTLIPWATVGQNIAVALELGGTPEAQREARIAELVETVGLARYRDYKPAALSGGMRQRAALGRLLAYAPELCLMDEPFGALDAMTKLAMGRELLRIWTLHGRSVVFVTHDVEEAVSLADRVVVMEGPPGRIRSQHRIDLARPRDVRELRRLPEFAALCDAIWADIGAWEGDGAPL